MIKSILHLSALFLAILIAPSFLFAQTPKVGGDILVTKTDVQQSRVLPASSLNINNLWLKIRNDGLLADSAGGRGLTYPMQYGRLVDYENFIWVGKVFDGQSPQLRTGGGIWETGVRPGRIVSKGVADDPSADGARVYRYRPDYASGDIRLDVAASTQCDISNVTGTMIEAMRNRYARDFSEWPWQSGAPFIDKNKNGIMDAEELPGIEGAHQVAWFVYNDLDAAQCRHFAGDPPIGLEVQVTLWAYKGVPNLEDVVFKRYRIIYKGTAGSASTSSIDSMYVTQWVDGWIGDWLNDLGGCDSSLSLGYMFNSADPDPVYRNLAGANPAFGYALLQGPLVDGQPEDWGVFDFTYHRGKRNLVLTSFMLNPTGDPIGEPAYETRTFWYWNVARGFNAVYKDLTYVPYKLPSGRVTKYMYSGDPIAKTGWIDGLGEMYGGAVSLLPGYRRFMMSTGPFTMALRDTQEVVIAIVASHASQGVENVTWLRNRTKYLRDIYPNLEDYVNSFVTGVGEKGTSVPTDFMLYQNYPNPFNPTTSIGYVLPVSSYVRLGIYDVLGREIRLLVNGSQSPGVYQVRWDSRDDHGNLLPSGVYFYQFHSGSSLQTRKMVLAR